MSGSSSLCLYPKGTVRAIRGIGTHSFSSLMSVGCGSFHLPMLLVITFFVWVNKHGIALCANSSVPTFSF